MTRDHHDANVHSVDKLEDRTGEPEVSTERMYKVGPKPTTDPAFNYAVRDHGKAIFLEGYLTSGVDDDKIAYRKTENDPPHHLGEKSISLLVAFVGPELHRERLVTVIGNNRHSVNLGANDRHEITKTNHRDEYIGIRDKTHDTTEPRVGKGADGPCRDTAESALLEPPKRSTVKTKIKPLSSTPAVEAHKKESHSKHTREAGPDSSHDKLGSHDIPRIAAEKNANENGTLAEPR